jgi:hypothetical protein
MASKKREDAPQGGRTARGSGERGTAHAATRARTQPSSEGIGSTPREGGQEAHAAPSSATGQPPAGLDNSKHAAAQKAAHQAQVLRDGLFPALMASALSLDQFFDTSSYKLYLSQVLEEAGNPSDPIERMLIQQVTLAHYRTAQLHVGASQAKGIEATKILNAAAARHLGEMRRTALALRVYRGRVPEGKGEEKLKIFKMAQ